MYIKEARRVIDEIEEENITKASELIYNAILNKNSIYTFGASHAGMISEEFFYRAGGLVLINPIFARELMVDTKPVTHTSQMERLEGYGRNIGKCYDFKPNDILIVHSVSGRNAVSIDLTEYAKEKQVKIICLTNLKYSKSVTSRHSSGKKLYELADIVIDNHGEIGDAGVKINGLDQKIGPTSTIALAIVVNSIVEKVVTKLQAANITPPIFYSANLDKGDELNRKIALEYKDVIHYKY